MAHQRTADWLAKKRKLGGLVRGCYPRRAGERMASWVKDLADPGDGKLEKYLVARSMRGRAPADDPGYGSPSTQIGDNTSADLRYTFWKRSDGR